MKKAITIVLISFFTFSLNAQNIIGHIENEKGEALVGANVSIKNSYKGTITNANGRFEITNLKPGNFTLLVNYLGYEQAVYQLELKSNSPEIKITLSVSENLTDEVLVKATRAGDGAPVASTTIDKSDLDKTNLGQDIPFLLNLTPSVTYSSDAGTGMGYSKLYIRGTDITRINVTTNGIPLNDSESHGVWWVNMPDLVSSVDDIEVQRGVGTSTNGPAAFGANISIKTNGLNKKPYANLAASYGSFNSYKAKIGVGSGLIKDHFSFDMRLSKIYSDGFIDRAHADLQSFFVSGSYSDKKTLVKLNVISGHENTYQAWWGVPKVRLENDMAGMQRYEDHYLYTTEQTQHMMSSDSRTYNYYTYDNEIDNYNQDHYQLMFSRELMADLSLNLALNYTKGKGYYEQEKRDEDLADYNIPPAIGVLDTIYTSDLIRRKWLDNDFYAAVYSLNYQKKDFSATIGGAYTTYLGKHYGNVIWSEYSSSSEIRHEWYNNTGHKQDFNIYGKFGYMFFNKLNMYVDLQYRMIDYKIIGNDDDLSDIGQTHHFDFFNPKFGLTYDIDDEHNAYFSVGMANREPSRTDFKDADQGNTPVAESLIDYELGYNLSANHARVNINLYYMDYNNQLVNTGKINNVGNVIMTNIPVSYRSGIELTGGFRFMEIADWQINASFSKNKIKNFTEFVDDWDNWGTQTETKLGDTDISFSPNIIMGSQLSFFPFENFEISLHTKFVSNQYIDNTSSEDRMLDAYSVSNLSFLYTLETNIIKSIDFKFLINNIFNEEYETNAWVYKYQYGGEYYNMDGYFPQAGINFLGGIVLNF
ncbi:MAG: TonB-dependent receptor [Bacteroidota bacterium]